ncbi:alsin [Anaeramoeba flamelloides]|nr:alsin [Anaeramoeba flamelloides]
MIVLTQQEEQKQMQRGKKEIRKLSQNQVGLPEKLISKSGWKRAIKHLQTLSKNIYPTKKLEIISETGEIITNTVKLEGNDTSLLNADNYILIFFYVLFYSNLPALSAQLLYIENLSDTELMNNKQGFFFTTISAASKLFIENELLTQTEINN